MSASPGWAKARRRLGGLAFLLVMVLLAVLSVALYQQRFSTVAMVTLYTASAGNEMHQGAEVMVRGVQVGEVRQISADGSGARLELAIQPGELPELPSNVTAEMLPTTLFGERYVDLILPASPAATTLAAGSVIRQDQSADGLELERVLNNLLPMLSALQPDKLSLTLTAIAQGLSGRGGELGQALVTLNAYLRQLNPQLPALDTDIRLLAGLTRTYTQAAPDVLQALSDFGVTGRTIAVQRADFAALLSNVTTASDDLRAFLDANSGNIIRLGPASLPTLDILARYAPEFPCTLHALTQFIPNADRVFGAGTDQPGLHVRVVIVPPPGRYLPRVDTPVYGDNLGPHCYPVPFPGIKLNDGVGRTVTRKHPATGTKAGTKAGSGHGARSGHGTAGRSQAATTAAWQPGSPAESELVRELTALSLGRSPASVPSWAGLLTAPLFRGTEVIVG